MPSPSLTDVESRRRIQQNLAELQISGKYLRTFSDVDFLERFKELLDWELLSCDKRLNWDSEKIERFNDKLIFRPIFDEFISNLDYDFIQRCFVNGNLPGGISMNPNLTIEVIEHYKNLWDWEILSSNPAILNCDIFESGLSGFINLYGLSHNKSLSLDNLLEIKKRYLEAECDEVDSYRKFSNEELPIKKYCKFPWTYAFANANINWNTFDIEHFEEILEESSPFGGNNWNGISEKLTDKSAIVKYSDKLNFYKLTIGRENLNDIEWDSEIVTHLLDKLGLKLIKKNYQVGLPDILEKINITYDAVIKHKDFWGKNYTYVWYTRTSDGLEEREAEFPLWSSLKQNKNITWTTELLKIMNAQKYDIHTKVRLKGTGKMALIVATKSEPWKKEIDVYNRTELYPENDYIAMIFIEETENGTHYRGVVDIQESEIESQTEK